MENWKYQAKKNHPAQKKTWKKSDRTYQKMCQPAQAGIRKENQPGSAEDLSPYMIPCVAHPGVINGSLTGKCLIRMMIQQSPENRKNLYL